MTAYYNENNPAAAAVLRELAAANIIAPGHVDDRSIKDVSADDLKGFTQCHFFAGAGLWSVGARLAGWPDRRPIWSASCPCQGESVIGHMLQQDDPRHLWPDLFRLLDACRPPVVVGEQVAAAAGSHWLDGVCSDLEGVHYAARAVVVPACSVNAPIERERIFFVAMGGTEREGLEGFCGDVADWRGHRETASCVAWHGEAPQQDRPVTASDDRGGNFWQDAEWRDCHDRKRRRTRPGARMLVDGMVGRIDLWSLAGNSIVPQLAAEVIAAAKDVLDGR